MNDITGEYWVQDGHVDFADGDIGDQNHEGIAISHVFHKYADEIESLADELEIPAEINHHGEVDTEAASNVLAQIFDKLTMGPEDAPAEPDPSTIMSDQQAHNYIIQKLGCNEDAYQILTGGGDGRLYAMQYEGWIAIRSNNVELYGYDGSRQREIADAVGEILYEENGGEDINPEEVELSIYDHKSRRSWDVTLADLEAPEVSARPNQLPTTTYNKILPGMLSKDSEENKYSNPAKGKKNKWTAAAQNAGITQHDLWRGKSEWFKGFAEWLRLVESL